MLNLEVKLLTETAKTPVRKYQYDSGADLFYDSPNGENIVIPAFESRTLETGVVVRLPDPIGVEVSQLFLWNLTRMENPDKFVTLVWELQIRSKSGLASNHTLFVLNSPGTVDNEYTGELKVILYNASTVNYEVKHGQKIAQAVVAPVVIPKQIIVDKFDEPSTRMDNGFGSTGLT